MQANSEDVERKAVSLRGKGRLLLESCECTAALESFDEAVTICRKTDDRCERIAFALARSLNLKGNALVKLNRAAEAVCCLDEAIAICAALMRTKSGLLDESELAWKRSVR